VTVENSMVDARWRRTKYPVCKGEGEIPRECLNNGGSLGSLRVAGCLPGSAQRVIIENTYRSENRIGGGKIPRTIPEVNEFFPSRYNNYF